MKSNRFCITKKVKLTKRSVYLARALARNVNYLGLSQLWPTETFYGDTKVVCIIRKPLKKNDC